MTQYTDLSCPGCQRGLRVRTEYLGKYINCKYCSKTFRASLPGEPAPAGEAARPNLAAQLDEARQRIVSLEELLQHTKLELAARTVEQTNGARTLRELQAERDQLQQQSLETIAKMAELANDLEPLRTERDRMRAEHKAAQAELQVHLGQAQQTQEEMIELKKKLITAVNVARNFKEVQGERDRLREESGHLRSQLQATAVEVERIGQLSEELRGLRAESERSTAERLGLEKQWAEERAALESDQVRGQAELQRLQDEVAALADSRAQLQSRLEASETECRELLDRLEADTAARRESEAELQSLHERIQALEADQAAAESRAEAEFEELRGKIVWYQQEVDVLRKSLNSFGIQVEY